MTIELLSSAVPLLMALSVAAERLVEIIKGLVPFLNEENNDPVMEGKRKSALQLLAVGAGLTTSWLAKDIGPVEKLVPNNALSWIPLGLLASGTSGFWNSIQTYVSKVKDVKKAEAEAKQPKPV